jgi:hypothetical protein
VLSLLKATQVTLFDAGEHPTEVQVPLQVFRLVTSAQGNKNEITATKISRNQDSVQKQDQGIFPIASRRPTNELHRFRPVKPYRQGKVVHQPLQWNPGRCKEALVCNYDERRDKSEVD